jgi:iron(III) transport system substrate-binding protein
MRNVGKWAALLGLVAASAVACAPAAAPAPGSSQAGSTRPAGQAGGPPAAEGPWRAEWERTLAAARQEGKVVVVGPAGDTFRGMLMAFQEAYPEIAVEVTGSSGRDFSSKILAERRAGQYLWDMYVGGADTALQVLYPEGVLDPIRPMLIRPEITDDVNWLNGFEWAYMDSARQYVRAFATFLIYSIHVNRDVVSEAELSKAEDLLNPRFKRRISFNEPRESGTGNSAALALMRVIGADGLRTLLREQEIAVTRDLRQQIEWLVRGQYPIALGVNPTRMDEFRREGLGLNVRPITSVYEVAVGTGGCACAINRAPHPNAAKLYLDWFLSKQGQTIWNRSSGQNSLRTDVEPGDPSMKLTPGAEYLLSSREENYHLREDAIKVAKETLP